MAMWAAACAPSLLPSLPPLALLLSSYRAWKVAGSAAVRPRATTTTTTTTTLAPAPAAAAAAAVATTTTGPQDLRQRRSFKIACVSRSAADLFPQRHDMSVPWQAAAGGPRIAPGSSYPYFLRSPPFRLISSLFALSLSLIFGSSPHCLRSPHFRLLSSLFAVSLIFGSSPHFLCSL